MGPGKSGAGPSAGASSSSNGSKKPANPPKRMGSLSSFQPMLNFSSSFSKPAAGATCSAEEDKRRMPPPPVPANAREVVSTGPTATRTSISSPHDRKGKKRAQEPIEVDSDEDDDFEIQPVAGRAARSEQMWTDQYIPLSEAELAPGKARVAKVKNWLSEALYGHPSGPSNGMPQSSRDKIRKYRRILLLTGPAGAGKTTTVKVLAREMGVDLVEWGEGIEEFSLGGGFERESPIAKLSLFLSRHAYTPLNMSAQGSSSSSRSRPRILLLTALPNMSHLPTRDAFHAALLDFCKTFSSSSCPLVIVHSDSGSGGRAEESWMDRERGGREGTLQVVGRDVQEGPWATEIDFISLAPTFITKALTRVLQQAVAEPAKRPSMSAVQLISLTSHGDLRSAINSLQLFCFRGSGAESKKRKKRDDDGPRKKGKGSRGGRGAKLDVGEDLRAVLDAVTRREQSLNLFHALGKVFYNKRLGDPQIDAEDAELVAAIKALPQDDPLPPHLSEFERSKALVQMDSFVPTIPVDASSFALWLDQSLPSFCDEIDEVSLAADDFCRADVMRTDDDIWQSSPQAIAYALDLCVRGAQMALPSPVARNHQKVVKPQFFAAYRTERENMGHLDTAAGYIVNRAVSASVRLSERPVGEDVEGVEGAWGAWGGTPTKQVLATELVPMMVKMQGMTSRPLLPASVRPLSMPLFHAASGRDDELHATERPGDDASVDLAAAGEDGMGVVVAAPGGWAQGASVPDDAGESGAEEDEEDIEDWD